jgi:hypothetical protein
MTVQSPRFVGLAHIVRPKADAPYYVGLETGIAQRYRDKDNLKVWQQPFPFDGNCQEALILNGKDLDEAGDTSQWSFEQAYAYAQTLIKTQGEPVTDAKQGGTFAQGKTLTGGRAAFYLHG